MNVRSTLSACLSIPLICTFISCSKPEESEEFGNSPANPNTLGLCVDIDGNTYATVKIGNQTWMAENLRVTRFQNGQAIPNLSTPEQWTSLSTLDEKVAYCFYDNNEANVKPYGLLYTWHTVMDSRGIAPKGWHIPSNEEWSVLGQTLGGALQAGGKLKSTGTISDGNGLWVAPNINASNSSGFNAVPAGERSPMGDFDGKGFRTRWWTTDKWDESGGFIYSLDIDLYNETEELLNNTGDNITAYNVLGGLSIRCVKD